MNNTRSRLGQTVLGIALLLAGVCDAAVMAAAPATLPAVLAKAHPGDTVAVTGAAPSIVLRGAVFEAPGVTIDMSATTVGWIYMDKSARLTVKGGHYTAVDYHGCVYVSDSHDVAVDGVTCLAKGSGWGIVLRGGSHISVTNNSLTGPSIYVGGITDFRLIGNTITAATADGIDIAGSGPGLISKNTCDGFVTQNGAHPDCVQAEAAIAPYPVLSHDVEESFNKAYGPTQGFDTFDGAVRFNVHDNEVKTSYPQGVALYSCTDCRAANNHMSTLPGSQFQTSMTNRGMSGVQCGNTIEGYQRWPAVHEQACPPGK